MLWYLCDFLFPFFICVFIFQNQEELERWRKAVQRHYKELKIGDKICELHFNQDEIIRHYETLLPDGTVWRIERSRVNLKNGAVPTIFPDSQNVTPCANNSQATKQPNSQNVEPCATNSQSTNQLNAQNSPRKRKFSKSFNNAVTCTKVAKSYAKILPKSKENNLNENPKHSVVTVKVEDPEIPETIANENFEQPRIALNEMTETFTYSTLVMSLELLSKPSLLWGITEQDEYVMCANWDEDSTLMKRVIIDCNLKIQVSILEIKT